MAIQSTAPAQSTDANSQSPVSGLEKAMDQDTTTKSEIVNSEPMREELVQMALKFLSHPTVRSSSVANRRSFLEKKGLTNEEIDEAFRRVPDLLSSGTIRQGSTPNQDVVHPQATAQSLQPSLAAPTGVISMVATPPRSRFYWSHAIVIVGLLAASGAGTAILLKNFILPRLKSWIRKVVLEECDDSEKNSKPSLSEEATAAANAAAAAAVNVAKASLEMLNSKKEESRYFEALIKRLDVQVAEMRSMSNAIQKLKGTREAALKSYKWPEQYTQHASWNGPGNTLLQTSVVDQEDPRSSLASSTKVKANGIPNVNGSVRPSSAPASVGLSGGQHPKSYMEIMAMIQRGEKPPGIKDINDSPPNPNQSIPNPHLAPRMKPWEVALGQNNSIYTQDPGPTSQLNGDSAMPWRERNNVRITELEPENRMMTNLYGAMNHDKLVQHSWVPPHPPSVPVPEAAAAIQHSKPLKQEISGDEQAMAHSLDETNELQKITKISELGGGMENNGGSLESNSNEIEIANDNGYEGN